MPLRAATPLALLLACTFSAAAEGPEPSRAAVIAEMRPYDGPSKAGVSRSTLTGKVVCGYQGWFTAPGDGSGRGWRHYPAGGRFRPGSCGIDLWPDVRELDDDEKYATPFRHRDGRAAYVFSSHNRKTVLRHFRWMEEYGIDGAFVQRFGVETLHPADLRHCNAVLAHCREGANRCGRCYALMYDLSLLPEGGLRHVVEDWKLLVDRMRLGRDGEDQAYLRHGGKPVVAVWGVGFNDGRNRSLKEVARHAERRWKNDLEWCRDHDKEYLPVVFPGFSWHNSHPRSRLDEIPRQKGRFLWKQYVEVKQAGATILYQAMFDEMDEGTAVFKVTNDPPSGESKFVTLDGLPSDHYLWLTGMGGKLLRGEIAVSDELPRRNRPAPAK